MVKIVNTLGPIQSCTLNVATDGWWVGNDGTYYYKSKEMVVAFGLGSPQIFLMNSFEVKDLVSPCDPPKEIVLTF